MFTTPFINTTNFSANFNGKLILQNFPTVRLASTKYYVGAKHLIKLNNNELGVAEVAAIRQFSFSQINNNLSLIDGGLTADKFKSMITKMYANKERITNNTQLINIIYSWVERDSFQLSQLINKWFEKTIAETKQNAQVQSQLNFQQC